MKFACRFGWHKWSKWTDQETFRVIKKRDDFGRLLDGGPAVIGRGTVQKRTCDGCGRSELRSVLTELI